MWTITSWYEQARREAEQHAETFRLMGECLLGTYAGELPGASRAEIAELLRKSNLERLDAAPSLAKYPELRGMRELIHAQWRGWRDGAQMTDEQWAAYCDSNFYLHRHVYPNVGRAHGCSYMFFPDSDHGPILANNLDSSPREPFGPPDWIAGDHLIIGGVSCGIFGDELSPEIFPAPVERLIERYCRSAREAVEMYRRYNYFFGPGNKIVINRNKCVAMIEKSSCRIGVRYSPDGFGFITAMTMEEPAMNAYLADRRAASLKARNLPAQCADTAYWAGADRRHALMSELLDEGRKAPTLENLRRFIQFRDPTRGQVCYNAEVLFPGGPPCEFTLRTTIWLLREGQAMWWAKEGDTPSFENRKPDVAFRDVWLWE